MVKVATKNKPVKPKTANNVLTRQRTSGERAADALSKWAGSWTFILSFLVFLGIWMTVNVYAWIDGWDPYPFILLNLVLSCIAALQAPVILMSQNRQMQKDRAKMEYDYKVNRRAERLVEEILKKVKRIKSA
ncbi:DUF1003 domain-containing protein [archaeon]|nr:DUF1003 domain-containing protein [archaeon]